MTALKERASLVENPTVHGQLEHITPQMAAALLERNLRNRHVRKGLVRQYADDMLEGRWHLTGEPIIFNEDGRLDNGQHRLQACVLSGVDFDAFVVYGVSEEAQKYMDSGAKRGAHDALALNGIDLDTKNIAAVARGILQFENGGRPSQAEIVDFSEANILKLAQVTSSARAVRNKISGRVATYGVAGWYLTSINTAQAAVFFAAMENGEGLKGGDSRLVLRNYIIKNGTVARNADASTLRGEVALIFKAWNAWREGREVSVIRFGRNEVFPQPK